MRRGKHRPQDEVGELLDMAIPMPCTVEGCILRFYTPATQGERIESLFGRKGRVVSFHTGKDGYTSINIVRVHWDNTHEPANYIYKVGEH